TITRFPIRRADIKVSVAYKEDLDRVKQILMDIAHQHPLCLQEPAPLIFFDQFGSSSIDLRLAVWAAREDWLTVKNEIYETVKRRFDEEGIEIPFPHVSIYAGAVSDPIKIQMVDSREKEENS
ncbi:MAG: mechanosensitive ion channel family protein, partial [Calditrichaeota bacterium]